MTSIYHEPVLHEGNVTNRYLLGQYGIPPINNRSTGRHTELIEKLLVISRDPRFREIFARRNWSEIYKMTIGGEWSHRCLPSDFEKKVDAVYSMITRYTESGELAVNASAQNPIDFCLNNIATEEEDKECTLFLKVNGIHISLYLSINPRQDSDTHVTCKIFKICGKQRELDGEEVRNADFAKVIEILLQYVKFLIRRELIPEGVTHLLLQGELAIKENMLECNHTDVCRLVFDIARARSMADKFRIAKKLDLLFFNVGWYYESTGLTPEQQETYKPCDLSTMEEIFNDLQGNFFRPDYNSGYSCNLQICPRRYFFNDCDKTKLRCFLKTYENGEGYILRIHRRNQTDGSIKIFCAKLKEVYTKTEGFAVQLPPGHLVFALYRAGDELSISGLIVAPMDPRETTETTITCRQLHIHQFLPRADPQDCFEGNTMWDAAANAITICKHGRVIPHEKTTSGVFRRYTFTFGGKSYTLHAQDVGKMNYNLKVLSLEDLFTNPEIPSCIVFKANQILRKDDRARADTAVFMGLIVPPGFHPLSRLTRQQQAEILMPPLNDSPFHALKRESKEFYRGYTFGTTNPKFQDEFYKHNLPQDLALQKRFVEHKTTNYGEFVVGSEKDVRLVPYYKLLALSIKPRPNAVTDERYLAQYLASPRPEPAPAQVRQEELSPVPVSRAEPARAAVKVSRKRKTPDMREFKAVELASDDLGIDNKQELYVLFENLASGDDADFEALRIPNPSPQQKLKLTKYYHRKKDYLKDHLSRIAKTPTPVSRQIEEDVWLDTSSRKRRSIEDNVIPFDVPASALAKRARPEQALPQPAQPEPALQQSVQPSIETYDTESDLDEPATTKSIQAQAPAAQAEPQQVPRAEPSVRTTVSAWDMFKHLIGDKDDNDKDLTLGSGADKDDDDGLTLGSGYPQG